MRLLSTAIVRKRDRDREQARERAEMRRGAKGKQITEPFACVSYPLQSCARETEIEVGQERRSERETNYGTARRICDPGEQVRCFGPFDSDKAVSPEFFLALGCWRRMREREWFHVVSPFVYHQSFSTLHPQQQICKQKKILGLQQKNSCFCHFAYLFISFTTHSLIQYLTIIGKDEIHFIPSPSRPLSHIQYIRGKHKIHISPSLSRNCLSFSTIVAKNMIHHIFPTPSRHFLSFRATVQRQRSLISTEMQRKNQGCLVGYKSFVFCPELPCQRKELHEKQTTNTSGTWQIPSGIAIVDNPFFSWCSAEGMERAVVENFEALTVQHIIPPLLLNFLSCQTRQLQEPIIHRNSEKHTW
jgi:hypothetical protein